MGRKDECIDGQHEHISGLKLSLRWRSKTAESENQLDTKELVELLKKDYRLMSEEEAARLSTHFRSKVEEARRRASDSGGMISFYQVMKETLDYRKWFEFQLFSQKKESGLRSLPTVYLEPSVAEKKRCLCMYRCFPQLLQNIRRTCRCTASGFAG